MSDTKWEILTKESKSNFSFFSYWPLGIVTILIAILSYFVIASKFKKAKLSKEPVEQLVQPEVIALDKKPLVDTVEAQNDPRGSVVKTKTFGNKYFEESNEINDIPEYDNFSNNLNREYQVIDKQNKTRFDVNHLKVESSDPAKFAEINGFQATDDFIDAWSSTSVKHTDRQEISDEYRMLAVEALQSIDTSNKPENAIIILREILAARTEALRIGATLPPMPEEQLQNITFWSKNVVTKDIATTILNRI